MCAPILVSKSLPSKGQGLSGMTKKEWVTSPVPKLTVHWVVQGYLLVPVAPWTQEDFSEIFPYCLVNTEC